MDYSQFQVKYIDNIDPQPIEISQSFDIPDTSSLDYLNGEAQPATALIQEEEPSKSVQKKRKSNPVRRAISFKPSIGLRNFNLYYDQAIQDGGADTEQLRSRRDLFTHIAQVESTFNSSVKNRNAPAYGYFQFMQGNYKGTNYNNITRHAKVDLKTFLSSPVLQIHAANSLANEFLNSFGKTNLDRHHSLGWTDNAIIAGAWLGGPGNVIKFAFRGIDSSDGNDSVGSRMRRFNY